MHSQVYLPSNLFFTINFILFFLFHSWPYFFFFFTLSSSSCFFFFHICTCNFIYNIAFTLTVTILFLNCFFVYADSFACLLAFVFFIFLFFHFFIHLPILFFINALYIHNLNTIFILFITHPNQIKTSQ